MNSRIVRLLDPPELTPRQLAQRRYQQSAKGKAASARWIAKKRLDAAYRAANVIRAAEWAKKNPMRRRVYKRVWQQTTARLRKAA